MKNIIEPARTLPVIREVDVLVAGGGPAGIAAAIAAARNGAKTMLVERFGYLGGMITGSYVTYYMGFGNGREQVIRGLAQETINRLREAGGLIREQDASGDCGSDAEIGKCLAVVMLEEAGVEILLHSWIAAALTESNACNGIIIENKAGRQAILAKTVIDATADADVCFSAGAATTIANHDISLKHSFGGIDTDKFAQFKNEQPDAYCKTMAELKAAVDRMPPPPTDVSAVDAWDLTAIENVTRKRLLARLAFMRRNLPGHAHMRIEMTAPQLGVRESRKLVGVYTITVDDLLADRKFDDGIGRCGAYMKKYENYDKPGLSYDIPYRVLVPEKVDGLLAAGRCISATHEAINTLRLIVPCILTGEAAGTAAALALAQGVPPRQIDIRKLQRQLQAQGNNLG
ncbi:MAG: FAD-dependent oxidoreductase [Kiritimatiellae bacterium]|nr:FAD-dependent oxidoreductase [Kiritimatiellia bacterium]